MNERVCNACVNERTNERAQAPVRVEYGCSIITAVGDSMHRDPQIPGRFMTALGEAGIRQLTMAQNLGARNISTVVRMVSQSPVSSDWLHQSALAAFKSVLVTVTHQ